MTPPDALNLGRHAFVVLASYGVGLAAIIGLVVQSLLAARDARRALEAEEGPRHG